MVNKIKEQGKKILIILFLLILMFLFSQVINYIIGTPCLSIYLFDIPCPFCGMTRAHISFLKGNLNQAFTYNPLFFLGLPSLYLMCNDKLNEKHPKLYKWLFILILSLLFIMNIMRILGICGLEYVK